MPRTSTPPSRSATSRSPRSPAPRAAATAARSTPAGGPLYQQLHQQLRAAIQSGQYAVHSSFPTEAQLSAQYGVSRHTVREATRRLVEEGLISKQPGAGTVVRATQPVAPYVSTVGTFQDAMVYSDTTRLEVLASRRHEADAALAEALRCDVGSVWIELTAMRHPAGQVSPMSYSRIYLRPAFAEIMAHLHGDHPSIYTLLHSHCGAAVDGFRQRIDATLMPDEGLALLQLPAGHPALHVLRAYYDAQDQLLAASVNWYIPARFRMETTWRREDGGAPAARAVTAR